MCCDNLTGRRGDVARHGPADDFGGWGYRLLILIVCGDSDEHVGQTHQIFSRAHKMAATTWQNKVEAGGLHEVEAAWTPEREDFLTLVHASAAIRHS